MTGRAVVPLQYDYAFSFSEGLAPVSMKEKHGYIDNTGKAVIALKYDGANSFSEGFAAVQLNKKWGFIDKTGREITQLNFRPVRDTKLCLAH